MFWLPISRALQILPFSKAVKTHTPLIFINVIGESGDPTSAIQAHPHQPNASKELRDSLAWRLFRDGSLFISHMRQNLCRFEPAKTT
jgi:hypothetical protein